MLVDEHAWADAYCVGVDVAVSMHPQLAQPCCRAEAL